MSGHGWEPQRVAEFDQLLADAHAALGGLVDAYGETAAVLGDFAAVSYLRDVLLPVEHSALVSTVLAAVIRMHAQRAAQ